jgi:hypothetical protein
MAKPSKIIAPAAPPASLLAAQPAAPVQATRYFNLSLQDPDSDDGDVAARPGTLAGPPGAVSRPDTATIYGARTRAARS